MPDFWFSIKPKIRLPSFNGQDEGFLNLKFRFDS